MKALLRYSFLVLSVSWIIYLIGEKPPTQFSGTFRIVVVCTDGAVEYLNRGLDILYQKEPRIHRQLEVHYIAPAFASGDPAPPIPPHDLLLVETMGDQWLKSMESQIKRGQLRSMALHAGQVTRIAFGPAIKSVKTFEKTLGLKRIQELDDYWSLGGVNDLAYFWQFLLHINRQNVAKPPSVTPVPKSGFARLDQKNDWEILTSFPDSWKTTSQKRVAVFEYPSRIRRQEAKVAMDTVEAFRKAGYDGWLLFGHPPSKVLKQYFTQKQKPDLIVSYQMKFMDSKAGAELERLNVPAINAISINGPTVSQWRESIEGLSSSEVAWQLAVPEMSGLGPHQVVGGREATKSGFRSVSDPQQLDLLLERVKRLLELKNTRKDNRRIALIYWNYPPGKQNIGASYLNVIRSIPQILQGLKEEGYDLGEQSLTEDELKSELIKKGRNLGNYAPGEMQRWLAQENVITLPVSKYMEWFGKLPKLFREYVMDHWGPPTENSIMTAQKDGELHFLLPVVRRGKIVLMAQPDRARTQDLTALYQSQDLPPHHQYVAAYLWLAHEYKAHGIIHLGTHGTQEWLSGKEKGLSNEDPGEVLLQGMPVTYPYIVDDIGEGIVAKRRGGAVVVDHLTPALGMADLAPELKKIYNLLKEWRNGVSRTGESDQSLVETIDMMVRQRGLNQDLHGQGWDGEFEREKPDQRFATLEDFLEQVRSQKVPFGLHTFGQIPLKNRLEAFAKSLSKESQKPSSSQVQIHKERIIQSTQSELDQLKNSLNGGFVPPGEGNDPIKNPQALPTGRNFYAMDPRKIPTESAWNLGKMLARDMVEKYREREGSYPKKFAFQLWGVETIRHAGVQESQILALLGVRPQYNKRGRVSGLELISREELGYPRVDISIHATSLYRDTFPILIELLDKAVIMAAGQEESDNSVLEYTNKIQKVWEEQGYSKIEALKRAKVRIFAEPPGTHDSKIYAMTEASSSWTTDTQVGETWIRRMGFGYGSGFWGEELPDQLREMLKGVQSIVHSRSSKLYATLDNDDYFSYGGSIALGVRTAQGGKSPPFYVTDLRTEGKEEHRSLESFLGEELRGRFLNPKFIDEIKKDGYSGARHVWHAGEYLWGWQVVYPEAVDEKKWEEMYSVWMKDRYQKNLKQFFSENNPWARQAMAGRMLEVVRKGYWDASSEIQKDLTRIFVENVVKNGVSCDHTTCNNPELQEMITNIGKSIPGLNLGAYTKTIREATGKELSKRIEERRANRKQWHKPGSSKKSKLPTLAQRSKNRNQAKEQKVTGKVMKEVHKHHHHLHKPARDESWFPLALMLASIFSGALVERKSL